MRKLYILVSVAILTLSCMAAKTPRYDICVYGQTASGVVAAVQAARMGKSVVLISTDGHVGGVAASGLTATDMNRQAVVGGLAAEFYNRVYEYYENPDAWRCQTRDEFITSTLKRSYTGFNHPRRIQWVYESSVGERIMKDMLREAGVKVIYDARLDRNGKVSKKRGNIVSIPMEDGSRIAAKMFIDATYEGDLLDLAGVSFIVGRESNAQYGETCNGIRVNYKSGKDLSAISPYVVKDDPSSGVLPYVDAVLWGEQGDADGRTQAYCYRMTLTDDPDNMIPIEKPAGYNPLWHEILARDLELNPETPLQKIITLTPMPNRKTDTNHLDFFGASHDYPLAGYAERAEIEQRHKDYALGMLWFLGNDPRVPEHIRAEMLLWGLPKDEYAANGNFPHQIYVREARRMVGDFVMTEHNVRPQNRTLAGHSVGMGSYALDCHYVSRVVDGEGKLRNEGTMHEVMTPYTISYYSIAPKKGECGNLLVPICLSSSHVAFSTIRMEPVYMILGQSAATAAALAIDAGTSVQGLPYERLRERLLADGQILEN